MEEDFEDRGPPSTVAPTEEEYRIENEQSVLY